MNKDFLRICFKPLTVLNRCLSKNEKQIFFYSNLGFRDNVRAFYEYLIENDYNKEYKIIVSINDYEDYVKGAPYNVSFISNKKGIISFMKSKYAFYCFGKYPIKPSKKQMVVNLWHGMPLKRIGNMERGLEHTDYNFFTKIVATSEMFADVLMKCFSCSREQVIITGQPRNDEMFLKDNLADEKLRQGARKLIVWLPTYREELKTLPIPILTMQQAEQLDALLNKANTRLIVKIHPWQKTKGDMMKFSNIEFLSQDDINKSGTTVYSMLRASDALITDYSSVYFDYMILNRPIGFTVDDFERYKKERGFVFDNPKDYMPGPEIETYEDLKQFVEDTISGRDAYDEYRNELNKKVNYYNDGLSSERIAAYVFGGQND